MNIVRGLVKCSGRACLTRSMSTLTPGTVLSGGRWNYCIRTALEGDKTHTSTVFRAEVLPSGDVSDVPKWALIKTVPPANAVATESLNRERESYGIPGVASASCFRKMYDVIDNSTIAFEWLDTTLAELKYQPEMHTYALINTILRSTLSSCAVLEAENYVNTDYKPANILLSDVDTNHAIAKVGDLGLVFATGRRKHAQPFAMRAPEVFLNNPCTPKSQIWAVAATLLCWIKPGILGNSPYPIIVEAWCMAKFVRLFPDWDFPDPKTIERETVRVALESALTIQEEPEIEVISPIEEELKKIEMPQELRDLVRLMLVTNPEKRPSASSVLASKELQAFDKLISN